MNQFIIRKLRNTDIHNILKKKYPFSLNYLIPKFSLTSKIFEIINNFIGIKNEKFSIVLESNNDIFGVLTYFNFDKKVWVAGPLFVSPNARGMGVGRKLVSFANNILLKKKIYKVYGDVPLNNPSKFLHTQLGCKFIDFTFVITIGKDCIGTHSRFILKPIQDTNSFKTLNQNVELYKHIQAILSNKMINFFKITEKNYYYPFESSLRKISRFFFKKVKYLVFNENLVLINEIRFKSIYDIMIFLSSIDDLEYLIQKIMNQLNFRPLTGRLFFKQSIPYENIQNELKRLGILAYLNETMIYIL